MPLITAHKKNCKRHKRSTGFTLIELSIVLVVIGLIVGGILSGQSLIRQSQINSVMMDAQKYISATVAFKQKYGALPGDMPNATSYWGTAANCPPLDSLGLAGVTCNGDGNTHVVDPSVSSTYLEGLTFWQHLVNAQLIQGNFTNGNLLTNSLNMIPGVDVPGSRISGAGFGINYIGYHVYDQNNFFGSFNYGHVFYIGGDVSSTLPKNPPQAPILTTIEMQGFDSKYDDGIPSTGFVQVLDTNAQFTPYCALNALTYNTATSGTNSAGLQCAPIIVTGF